MKYLFLLLFSALSILPAWAGDEPAVQLTPKQIENRQNNLWQQASDFRKQGDDGQAALYFSHFAKTYPDHAKTAEALWYAATLYHRQAKEAADHDFSKARALYQRFIVAFPASDHIADAYLAMADTYFASAYFREANNYYTLFLKNYRPHPQTDLARWKRAQSRVRINKLQGAREDYALLSLSSDHFYVLRGQAGLGHIYFAKGEWHNSLGILLRILHQNPDFYVHDPSILENLGIASLRVGSNKEGRRFLLHYINIADQANISNAIYFELAESFMAEGQIELAKQFYQRIIAAGSEQNKLVIISQFRLAQFKAARLDRMSERKKAAFVAKKGDKIFQTILDDLYTNPVSQEARFALFDRYLERQEYEAAYAMGKAYLRYKTSDQEKNRVQDWLGKILFMQIEPLLADKNHEAIRTLYEEEFKTISTYPRASLLTIIGSAFAAEGLYDQASVIYYRAMALEMNEEEKSDLYLKRAQVYLANNDIHSSQRLLKYLRQIYQKKPSLCKVNWLSGHLREAQKRPDDALTFYKMAVEGGKVSPDRAIFGEDYLRLLLEMDPKKCGEQLAIFKKNQWLPPETIQTWYARLGDSLLLQQKDKAALTAYRAALTADLPESSRAAQTSHLHMGDLLAGQNKRNEALAHFKNASTGPAAEITSQAQIRLEQAKIKTAMNGVKGMLE